MATTDYLQIPISEFERLAPLCSKRAASGPHDSTTTRSGGHNVRRRKPTLRFHSRLQDHGKDTIHLEFGTTSQTGAGNHWQGDGRSGSCTRIGAPCASCMCTRFHAITTRRLVNDLRSSPFATLRRCGYRGDVRRPALAGGIVHAQFVPPSRSHL